MREGDLVVTLELFNGGAAETRAYDGLLRKWVHGLAWSKESRYANPCLVWYDIVWDGMAWDGMGWYGTVRYGMVWYSVAWYGML